MMTDCAISMTTRSMTTWTPTTVTAGRSRVECNVTSANEHRASMPSDDVAMDTAVGGTRRAVDGDMSFMHANGYRIFPLSGNILLASGEYETEKSRTIRVKGNIVQPYDECACDVEYAEEVHGPYYTHLGAAPDLPTFRRIFECRTGFKGIQLRIEKVVFTGKEGMTPDGCPVPKWIIKRTTLDEKMLLVVKVRPGHTCATAVMCLNGVLWEGAAEGTTVDQLYDVVCERMTDHHTDPTNRRCGTNDKRTCACQGVSAGHSGASFSFGCSWSMYYNACKFARSHPGRQPVQYRFATNAKENDTELEWRLKQLGTIVRLQYARCFPAAHDNQTLLSYAAAECRLDDGMEGAFTGITACIDFCAHSHKDGFNMNNGSTVVVSMCRWRGLQPASNEDVDEQYHVLPMYIPATSDEFGSEQEQQRKTTDGRIEQLTKYTRTTYTRKEALAPCRKQNQNRALKRRSDKAVKCSASSPTPSTDDKLFTSTPRSCDNTAVFADGRLGGVAMQMSHGCILFEVAKREVHCTTALRNPDRRTPKRISLVYYHHKNMNSMQHGYVQFSKKTSQYFGGEHSAVEAEKELSYLQLPASVGAACSVGLKLKSAGLPMSSTRDSIVTSNHVERHEACE